MLAEGCRRIQPVFIEDEDAAWEAVLRCMDRWGDRRVPKALVEQAEYRRSTATLNK